MISDDGLGLPPAGDSARFWRRLSGPSWFWLAVTLVFVGLLMRSIGLYPVVLSDEYYHNRFSRLVAPAEASIPGYLYAAIYGLTNLCGDSYLQAARILNAFFFVAAAPFIYLSARRVCAHGVAAAIALLALLGPINSYTAYFMPEALYFLCFWVLTWLLLRLDATSGSTAWCSVGVMLGLSALVKPHALFCIPAVVAYIGYVAWRSREAWLMAAVRHALAFGLFTFATKLLIGFAFAGEAAFTLFGSLYGSIATETSSQTDRYLQLLSLACSNASGHLLGLAVMYALPVAAVMVTAFVRRAPGAPDAGGSFETRRLSFWTLAVVSNLVAVVALFSASIAHVGPEEILRLHMRYYNFTLPLLSLVAASQLRARAGSARWRWALAVPVGAVAAYAAWSQLAPFAPNYVDSPELQGFLCNLSVFCVLSGLSLLSLLVWAFRPRIGAALFVYCLAPVATVVSTYYVNQKLRLHMTADVYDLAGMFTRQYLSYENQAKLLIVGSVAPGVARSLLYIDNPKAATIEDLPSGASYDPAHLPADKQWVLVIGDHPMQREDYFRVTMDGFVLVRRPSPIAVDFRGAAWPGVLSAARGLAPDEGFGRWSVGDVVTLEFVDPLPPKFAMRLLAKAFGPNVGKTFVARVGASAVNFTLGAEPEEKVLLIDNPALSKTLTIEVPKPYSPKELGVSGDERKLGIGLSELQVAPL
ncbi:MAG: glycosyltransferase family 39 protein [Planctomycetota bacterium]